MNQNKNKFEASALLRLMRPSQWVKNAFVLAPLVFAGRIVDPGSVADAVIATLLFCLASSLVYVLNDLSDIEDDRKHPEKSSTRPLAAGEATVGQAWLLLGCIALLLLTGFLWNPAVMYTILAYIALNIAYTFYLKDQPVIDIFVIAIGFVLRVQAGAAALEVEVSSWMFATTLCLALYLASVKRRQELIHRGDGGRKVLQFYEQSLIDRYVEFSATGALLFYALFVLTSRPELTITIPVVIFGFFRYWYIVEIEGEGESPTDALLHDWQLILTALVWIALSAWGILVQGA